MAAELSRKAKKAFDRLMKGREIDILALSLSEANQVLELGIAELQRVCDQIDVHITDFTRQKQTFLKILSDLQTAKENLSEIGGK